jgi:hypothetical protein
MDVIKVSTEIEHKIAELEKGRQLLQGRAERKAQTIAHYDKRLSIVIIQLKNGVEFIMDEQAIKDPPATFTEKIARGICWQERLDMEQAEAEYKNAVVGMDALMAALNGWQSINRHLETK